MQKYRIKTIVHLACALLGLMGIHKSQAQTAPVLASVSPLDGAINVPTQSSLVFVFDQDMDVSLPLISGAVGNFEVKSPGFNQTLAGIWSSDKRTVTVKPAIQFPYGTFVWTINPVGTLSFLKVKNKAGVEVATVSGTFTTGVGVPNPKLISSNPANAATEVPITNRVEFKFDLPMKTNSAIAGNPPSVLGAVVWAGNGIDPTKFSYSWSSDSLTLICDYAGGFGTNKLITWILNPEAAPVRLESQTGKPLANNTYSGHFTTETGLPPCDPGLPDGWGTYGVVKNSNFNQSTAADPVPGSVDASFVFSAVVTASGAGGTFTSGSVALPDGTTNELTELGTVAQFYETQATEAGLNVAFPSGDYILRFTRSGTPERIITMSMPADAPPIPKIVNFTEAQSINADGDFTLLWNNFLNAGPEDFISLYISDDGGRVLFQAPDVCLQRPLPMTATSIVIPSGTLSTNSTFTGAILFGKSFYHSTNAIPQMSGYGSIIRTTHFTIKTGTGGNTTPPAAAHLTGYRLKPNGNPELNFTGTVGGNYAIQRTGQLEQNSWDEVGIVTIDLAGEALFEDTQANKTFPLFYRVVSK